MPLNYVQSIWIEVNLNELSKLALNEWIIAIESCPKYLNWTKLKWMKLISSEWMNNFHWIISQSIRIQKLIRYFLFFKIKIKKKSFLIIERDTTRRDEPIVSLRHGSWGHDPIYHVSYTTWLSSPIISLITNVVDNLSISPYLFQCLFSIWFDLI